MLRNSIPIGGRYLVLDASLLLLTPPVPFIYPPPLLLLFYSLLSFALTLLWFSLLISLFLPSLLSLPLYHNPHPLASFLPTHTFLLPLLLPFSPFLPLTLYYTANKTENSGKMTYIFLLSSAYLYSHQKPIFEDSLHKETFRGNFRSNTGFWYLLWTLRYGVLQVELLGEKSEPNCCYPDLINTMQLPISLVLQTATERDNDNLVSPSPLNWEQLC